MAWSTPATWVAGAVLTAAQLNAQLRDNLNAALPVGVDAWTAYTPVLTQSGAVSKTIPYSRYMKVGRLVSVSVQLVATSAGVAANPITVSLPFTAAATLVATVIGSGYIYDASATATCPAVIEVRTGAAVVHFIPTNVTTGGTLGSAAPMTAALAAGDLVTFSATYEAAS